MRRVLPLVLLALGVSTAQPIARQAVRSPTVVIKAARMFDGRSDTAITDAIIVVEGTSITAAGSRLAIPPGSSVVDLGDVTLLPGFIDAHTHLSDEASDDWNADTVTGLRRTVAEAALRASQFAERTLRAGFTTVRDVGSSDYIDVGLRNAIRAGVIPGPRMLVAVHALEREEVTATTRDSHTSGSALSRGSPRESPRARTSSGTRFVFRSSTART